MLIDIVSASLCLRVQKNAPETALITHYVCGFKKMHPQQFCLHTVFAGTQKDTRDVAGEGVVFAGSKKCTRNGFECCHPERSEGSPPSQPKDNVVNLVIAGRTLPDMAISFAQCVILSVAKHLLAGRLRRDSSLHSE